MEYVDNQSFERLLPEAAVHINWDYVRTSDAPWSIPTVRINYLQGDYLLNSYFYTCSIILPEAAGEFPGRWW